MALATFAVLIASVIGQTVGVAQGSTELAAFAAAAFAGAVLRLAWQINSPWWHIGQSTIGPGGAGVQPLMAERNASLLALGYGWGGASLLAVYLLTPLRWQHGWQYGSGMVLIALIVLRSGRWLAANWRAEFVQRLILLSMVHGWAACAGLFWLIYTGKMLSHKGDWAANVVFVAGAVIIGGVSAAAVRTARLLQVQATTAKSP